MYICSFSVEKIPPLCLPVDDERRYELFPVVDAPCLVGIPRVFAHVVQPKKWEQMISLRPVYIKKLAVLGKADHNNGFKKKSQRCLRQLGKIGKNGENWEK
jgi:hypothetical protein